MTLNTLLSGVVGLYHAWTCTPPYLFYQHTKFEVPSFTDFKYIIGLTVTWPRLLGGGVIPRLALDIFYTGMQNLATFASAVPQIWLRSSNLKMGHVTLTTPLLEWFVILQLGHDIVHQCIKFDDSRFSRSKDIIGAPRFKMGHVIVSTPV